MAVVCNAFCKIGFWCFIKRQSTLAHDLICIPRLLLFAFVFQVPPFYFVRYSITIYSLRYHIQIRWTHARSHLSQQRCGDAVVESAEAVSLKHANTHPEHPVLRLLLCLQVNLRKKCELWTNPDSLCCCLTRIETHIKHFYLYLFMQLKCILNVTYLDEVERVSNTCGACAGHSSKIPARLSFGWIDSVGHLRLQRKLISKVLKNYLTSYFFELQRVAMVWC